MNSSVPVDTSNLEIDEPCDAGPFKRRSCVFQSRRSKLFIDEETDKTKELEDTEMLLIHNHKRLCLEDVRREENFDLQKYIEDLKKERRTWQVTLKERKSERRALSRQKSSLEQLGQNLDLKILSDSERSFLLARPNYEYIYENNHKLSDTGLKMILLNELIYKLNERFMLRMRENLCLVTKQVIEMST